MVMEVLKNVLREPVLIAIAAVFFVKIIDFVILKSTSKKDDFVWNKIKSMAGHAYNLVELIERSGGLKVLFDKYKTDEKKIVKYNEAIDIFRERYYKEMGKFPDKSMLKYIGDEFCRLAINDKILKETIIESVKDMLKKKVIKKR